MGIEIYSGSFSFELEDSLVLPDVSHLPFVNSLGGTYSLSWLSWEPVIFYFLGEIFLISVEDIVDLYNISICYQAYVKTWVVAPSSFK